ncbi:unnamed protein product, partial [Polarella glacialis]
AGELRSARKSENDGRRLADPTYEKDRSGHEKITPGPLSDGFKERSERTVYISRLPPQVTSKHDVADAFGKLGLHVDHIHVRTDRKFGFVHFKQEAHAVAAIGVRMVNICGSRVEVRSAVEEAPVRKRAFSPGAERHSRGPGLAAPNKIRRGFGDRPDRGMPPPPMHGPGGSSSSSFGRAPPPPRLPPHGRGPRPPASAPAIPWHGNNRSSGPMAAPAAPPPPGRRPPPRPSCAPHLLR